jgi:phosphopentomutase
LARELLRGEFEVARVIARPFEGRAGSFARTTERRDLSVEPSHKTVLDCLIEGQIEVWGVGKVEELFGGRGFSRSFHTRDNYHGVELTLWCQQEMERGLIFMNLIEFDMLWGHRNDPIGFYRGLQDFDKALPRLESGIRDRGYLIITADHGCDPTTPSTDHSREYAPLLVFDGICREGRNLGIRASYADVGATIGHIFGIADPITGKSFLEELPSFHKEPGRN